MTNGTGCERDLMDALRRSLEAVTVAKKRPAKVAAARAAVKRKRA